VLGALSLLAIVAVCAFAASYIMWRASSRSGLWGLIAGALLGIVAFGCAVLIGLAITRAWFRN
jgi:hypothetical protein